MKWTWGNIFRMGRDKTERKELRTETRIADALESIAREFRKFNQSHTAKVPTSIQMIQGDKTMAFAILPGATGTFGLTLTPAGSAFPASTVITWTADNSTDVSAPTLSLASGTTPAGLTAAVTSLAAPVATSFNLTATAVFPDPNNPGQSITLTTGPMPVTLGSGVVVSPVPTAIAMTQIS